MNLLRTAFVQAPKNETFTLSSGKTSKYYFDFRRLLGSPILLEEVCKKFNSALLSNGIHRNDYDLVCGVPYGAIPLATTFSIQFGVPMIMVRKAAKEYGLKNIIEGNPQTFGKKRVVLLEDVVTTGKSIRQIQHLLAENGFQVVKSLCILNRERADNITAVIPNGLYKLFVQSQLKNSRLILSPDLADAGKVLELIEKCAPYAIAVKLHFDVCDWSPDNIQRLQNIIAKENLVVINDRKYNDIGSTVLKQISHLESLVGVKMIHTVLPSSGNYMLNALHSHNHEMILVKDMSTGTAMQYIDSILFKYAIVGVVSQKKTRHFTVFQPGISLSMTSDGIGQCYTHPSEAVGDFIIVGRDIYNSKNPVERCKEYNK